MPDLSDLKRYQILARSTAAKPTMANEVGKQHFQLYCRHKPE